MFYKFWLWQSESTLGQKAREILARWAASGVSEDPHKLFEAVFSGKIL
jgi:hypothetical protein